MGRAALWLIASDALLQGLRYAFLLYLGYGSLAIVGAFLFGAAWGAVIAVLVDFGINQHWLRLSSRDEALTKPTFTRVFAAKTGLSIAGMAVPVGLVNLGVVSIVPLEAMGAGLLLATLHGLAEACESVALTAQRHVLVSMFRSLLAILLYGSPMFLGWLLMNPFAETSLYQALQAASICGVLMICLYAWTTAGLLPSNRIRTSGYPQLWWDARWLGINQTAIVVDVRAPVVILGTMLGEAAVGLYGLVQRTTAIVELVWASVSKLLLKSYADAVTTTGAVNVRARMVAASKITACTLAGLTGLVWAVTWYADDALAVSPETSVALSLLRWAFVAISLSSIKRPVIAGLVALYQERAVSRINLLSAAMTLLLVPLLVWSAGIWGPVTAWILVEGAACVLLLRRLLAMPPAPRSDVDGTVPQRAGL